ncbi:putative manganese-dependent inorganic diphosphatase [Limisalsivibrio acetivorans]|uniref:putative manganese-dependent inorganic diphosphatase n=1 Tax=Limisalsivibrio acetivorans TaxID=1304888 RepID=UPI0003B53EE8|nr:putative manganese-dependent inorganic diphosphatase [Limisalsivibrio acetivorans]
MSEILVIGHKNPDTDSIASAYCYAELKKELDKSNRYLPARCGNINKQTRYIFDRFGVTPPPFIKDVYPKVSDVMTHKVVAIDVNEPVYGVIRNIDELKIRITPVVSGGNRLEGVVSIYELSEFLATRDVQTKPVLHFRAENFAKVIKGHFHYRGKDEEFSATVMIGAMPYDRFRERMEAQETSDIVLVVGKRRDIIEYAVRRQLPAIILTGIKDEQDLDIDFSGYEGWVYISELDTAETMRRLQLSLPTKAVMAKNVPTCVEEDYLETVRETLLSIDHKGMPVVKEDRLSGIITRSDLIKKAQRQLILMDHNEMGQAVDGADSAKILEIVDHHRLGTIKTMTPIHFFAKPVGSTCTLVFQQYRINGVEVDKSIAGLLLSGILSDTVILKSPTTTDEDIRAVEELSEIAGLDYSEFGVDMFSATDSLKTRKPESVITTDFKMYEEFGVTVGISQVEVVTLEEVEEVKDSLFEALETVMNEKQADWGMLLITDIIREESILLTTGFEAAEKILAYNKEGSQQFRLPGVLSRKKQLLPEVLRVLEELNG